MQLIKFMKNGKMTIKLCKRFCHKINKNMQRKTGGHVLCRRGYLKTENLIAGGGVEETSFDTLK